MQRSILSLFFICITLTQHVKGDSFAPTEIQVSKVDHFLASETPSLALFEGAPNVVINNHVHAITGTFFDHQTDLELNGFGFSFDRTYTSQDHTRGSLLHGWNHSHEDVLHTEAKAHHRYAVSKGGSGGEYLFKGYFDESHLVADTKNFKKGVTNCNGDGISGRTNVLNHRLSKKKEATYSLRTGSGAEMHFDKKYGKDHYHQIIYQRTPSNFHIDYSYNTETKRLAQVVYKSPEQKELLSLKFEFPTEAYLKCHCKDIKGWRKKPEIKVSTSDGRYVNYTLQAFDRHYDEEDRIDRRRFRVSKVSRSNAPEETYQYSKSTCCCPEQVIRKNRPDGRYLEIDYYSKGNAFSLDKVGVLKGPSVTSPEPVVLYRFFYEKQSSISATTLVQDGLGHRTIYYYNPKNFRLKSVEKLYGNSTYSLHSVEELHWGDEVNGSPLLAREVYDFNRNLVLKRAYQYDSRGNVLKSTLQGNLTGNSPNKSFDKTFTYSSDGFNLTTSSTEGPLHKEFTYLPGTDLVTAEYTRGGPFSKRVFYSYDENHAVALVITDDGGGRDLNDLSGVTERQIKRIQNTKTAPVGLPETVELLYLDLSNYTEVLLKKTTQKYDNWGRCVDEVVYDSTGNLAYACHSDYNDYGQKVVEVDPLGTVTRYSYDMNGNMLTEHRLSDDRLKTYTYDFCNRVIKREIRGGGELFVETFEYDILGNKIASTDVYGNKTLYHHDALSQLCTIIHPETLDGENEVHVRKEFREYDVLGNLSLVVDGNRHYTYTSSTVRGAPYLIKHPDGTTEKFEYSLTGNLVKYIGQNGSVTMTDYDELSRPVSENVYSQWAELLRTKEKRYNSLHLIEETDADGLVTRYSYDGAGRTSKIEKGNSVQTFEYDALGRKAVVTDGVGNDAILHITHYDNLDRIVSEQTRSSQGVIQSRKEFQYDCDGNCIVVKTYNQAGEHIQRTQYNALGQLIKEIDPLNNVTYIFHDMASLYGLSVQRVTTVDPMGNQKIQYHNKLGEMICELIKNPYGETVKETSFAYDHAGNRTSRLDHRFSPKEPVEYIVTSWTYDSMNRLASTTEQIDQHTSRNTSRMYDRSGNLITLVKPDKIQITYEYDLLGRIERYFSTDGTVDYSFEYEDSNDPVAIFDTVNGTTTIRYYDQNRRLVEETFAKGLSISYRYDTLGRITEITYPDHSSVRYGFDGIRMVSVERFGPSGEFLYTHKYKQHDLSGNTLQSELLGNLGAVNSEYDLLNRIKVIATPYWQEKNHIYDAVGNLISREWDETRLTYGYDDLYQLQSESGFSENSYQNDSMFNQVVVNNTERKFNIAHELQGIYRYDINGNVIQKGGLNFEYDALNRLKKVTLPESTFEYRYDSYHRRVSKFVDGGLLENYFYTGQCELGAIAPNGSVLQARVLGKQTHADIGAAISVEIAGKVYAPLHDSQGNVVTLVDLVTGKPAESCRYTAYGQEITEQAMGEKLSPWRCASKRFESDTGLIDFGRRFYDPEEMRWISLDPILLSEGTNRYNYLENNPFRYIDSDGRFAFVIILGAMAFESVSLAAIATAVVKSVAIAAVVVGAACTYEKANRNGYLRCNSPNLVTYDYTNTKIPSTKPAYSTKNDYIDAYEPKSYSVGCSTTETISNQVEENCYLDKRSAHCDPCTEADGSPHSVIEMPGPDGKYTTFNEDGTFKQYRGSGKDHGGIPRPNVKENGINESPKGPIPGRATVRPAFPWEVPGGMI